MIRQHATAKEIIPHTRVKSFLQITVIRGRNNYVEPTTHARMLLLMCMRVFPVSKRGKKPGTNFSRYIVQREAKLNSLVLRVRVIYTSAFRSCFRSYEGIRE